MDFKRTYTILSGVQEIMKEHVSLMLQLKVLIYTLIHHWNLIKIYGEMTFRLNGEAAEYEIDHSYRNMLSDKLG
jgi:hypothetical protein